MTMYNERKSVFKPLSRTLWDEFKAAANDPYKTLRHPKFGEVCVKRDVAGYIIIPEELKLKSGWGDNVVEAYRSFLSRNGIE